MQVRSLSQEGLLEEEMDTHSSILAWRIPWTEEPGVPQSMESQRFRHNLVPEHAKGLHTRSDLSQLRCDRKTPGNCSLRFVMRNQNSKGLCEHFKLSRQQVARTLFF